MPAIVRNRELNVCAYPTQDEIDLIPFYSLQNCETIETKPCRRGEKNWWQFWLL